MKLYIIGLVLIIAGCTGYQVIQVCESNRLYYRAVMPWQEKPDSCFGPTKYTISDEECLMMLNLVAKHNDQPLLEAPQSCNKDK